MNKLFLILTFLLISMTTACLADQTDQVITLKDGSQIKGVLSGINNGIYTVKTPIIGDIHVAATDVASITNGNAPAPILPTNNTNTLTGLRPSSESGANLNQQIAASQQKLISNPQSMALLMQMAQDPEIAQALQDPALMQAVANHDYQAVQGNAEAQKLMTNPKMQALIQKLAAQQRQQNTSSQ